MPNSSDDQPDPVLAKIRKLLAKAEDSAATAEEADVYNAKASELMAAYGIDRALLAAADPDSDVVGDRVVVLEAPYARDKASLLSGVAHQMRCRAVLRTRYPDGAKELSLHLFGYDSDLLRADLLYTSLLVQASIGMVRAPVPVGESVAAFRRSWLAGFTRAVVDRLAAAEEKAASDAEREAAAGPPQRSVALVLADRSAVVDDALARQYPRLHSGRRRALSGSGMADGWAAGQRADLGGGKLGRPSRPSRGALGA
ncbi:MAG TPA: DUF2786 domain-containing protein [Nocardioidaceae bacterium]|nr:DUF2786 domain-containing protein [Nocardioidaceae bacterium]